MLEAVSGLLYEQLRQQMWSIVPVPVRKKI